VACLSLAEGGNVGELSGHEFDVFGVEAVLALQFEFAGLDVGLGGADDDAADHEEPRDHAALDVSDLDGVVVAPEDHLPLLLPAGRILVPSFPEVVLEGGLHEFEHFERVVGQLFVEVLVEGVEVVDLDGQDVFAISDLEFESFVVDARVFAAEVVQEVLEDVLVVRVAALHREAVAAAAQVLVREVYSLPVHSRNYYN